MSDEKVVSVPVREIKLVLSLLERHGYGRDSSLLRRIRAWIKPDAPTVPHKE